MVIDGMIGDHIDGLMCDLDGVVYRGDEPIAGVADAIASLSARGVRIVFCTNNSRSTVQQYVEKLARLGVGVEPERIVTSAVVAREVLEQRELDGKSAIVVGGDGLRAAVVEAGLRIEDDPDLATADVVAVGWDRGFDFAAMTRASSAVRSGALFVATNDDASFPAPRGALWPGAGAILASIEVASGRRAEVVGKPHAPMMEAVARRLEGCRTIAVVGDRPDTDLAGGRARGWITILVLSGVTSPEEAGAVRPAPDLVVDSLPALAALLEH